MLTALLLLTSCAAGVSSAVTPDLVQYSPEFQAQAAAELTGLAPPCAQDVAGDYCSAVHRLVMDYGDMREKVRAIRKE